MQTNLAIELEKHSFFQFAENLKFPVIATDLNYVIRYANRETLKCLDLREGYLLGLSYWEITKTEPNQPSLSQIMEEVQKKGFWQGDLCHKSPSGDIYVHSTISTHSIRIKEDILQLIVHHNIDISDKVKKEKKLRLEKLQAEGISDAKSIFVSTMSHEIRTPMNGILGATDLLLSSDLKPEDKECVEIIHHSTRSLIRIVNDILDFSKIESGQMKLDTLSIDPKTIVNDVFKLLKYNAKDKGLDFNISLPLHGPQFFIGDPLRIRQILLNLASNAIKFTPKGNVDIKLSYKQESDNGYLCIFEVVDTGIGMHPSELPNLFKNFSQVGKNSANTFGGTGLGLSISKSIAQIMQGDITVYSEPGNGSKFTLVVPMERTEKKFLKKVVNLKELKRCYKKHILVVEDNKVNQQIIKKTLEYLGIMVSIANHGAEAVDITKEMIFDLILMDIRMPGIDGLQTTHFIRNRTNLCRETPIVAMTATVLQTDRKSVKLAGINGLLEKPVRIETLVEILDKFFKNK